MSRTTGMSGIEGYSIKGKLLPSIGRGLPSGVSPTANWKVDPHRLSEIHIFRSKLQERAETDRPRRQINQVWANEIESGCIHLIIIHSCNKEDALLEDCDLFRIKLHLQAARTDCCAGCPQSPLKQTSSLARYAACLYW